MQKPTLDVRWLAAAVLACGTCVAAVVVAIIGVPDPGAKEALSGLAWMAAIVALTCAVRGGIDAGVHRGPRHHIGSR